MDDKKDFIKPLIHGLYEKPMSGADIETRSFAVIDGEASAHRYSLQEWEVVRRMIHTVGDFGILGDVPTHNTSEEASLRAAGFATASIPWNAVSNQPRGWTQHSRGYSRWRSLPHAGRPPRKYCG